MKDSFRALMSGGSCNWVEQHLALDLVQGMVCCGKLTHAMHAWMMSALGVHDVNLGYYLPAGSLPVSF